MGLHNLRQLREYEISTMTFRQTFLQNRRRPCLRFSITLRRVCCPGALPTNSALVSYNSDQYYVHVSFKDRFLDTTILVG